MTTTESILGDMTAPKLLDVAAVADLLGLEQRTVRNYHHTAARNRRDGATRPGDFPEPDAVFGRSPVWKASTIQAWERRRPGQGVGGGRPRKDHGDE
jgi:predicted DNA-binding transcriptional regulator AlpA